MTDAELRIDPLTAHYAVVASSYSEVQVNPPPPGFPTGTSGIVFAVRHNRRRGNLAPLQQPLLAAILVQL